MKKIELKSLGSFLASRTRAQDLLSKEFGSGNMEFENIVLDFNEIENVSQSFLSELFFRMKEMNIDLETLKYLNLTDENIKQRVSKEIERIQSIR